MERECQKIRESGFSYDNEELLDGMVAIAIPVFNKRKQIVLTIAIHGPTQRVSIPQLEKAKPALKAAAEKLLEVSFS
jgi:DNA-binding IclR family transcriptional regulator